MTPEQFWYQDPDYLWAYWDAYEQRQKQDAIDSNVKAFNQGQYFLLAIAHCMQFTKHPKQIYPKKPFELDKKNKTKMSQEQYNEIRKIQMQNLANKFKSNKEK